MSEQSFTFKHMNIFALLPTLWLYSLVIFMILTLGSFLCNTKKSNIFRGTMCFTGIW